MFLSRRALLNKSNLGGAFFSATTTNANQTVVNDLNLASGGMVWTKARSGAQDHYGFTQEMIDASRAYSFNTSIGNVSRPGFVSSLNQDGFTAGAELSSNTLAMSFKFGDSFNVVNKPTSTPAGTAIAHGLSSTPKVVMAQFSLESAFSGGVSGGVWFDSMPGNSFLTLQSANDAIINSTAFMSQAPDSSNIYTGNATAGSGYDYFCFGGDSVATGSYIGNATVNTETVGAFQNLGFKPRFIIIKGDADNTNWVLLDYERGLNEASNDSPVLYVNSDSQELTEGSFVRVSGTGFWPLSNSVNSRLYANNNGVTYYYMAIK